ncbi:pyridoxal-phosphate dependent enzyme [Pseudorhodoferax sp. LjRoot39]|uniref:pyridoxal-phosphate dependent enzyme n=1 Tax=Pseudorhodoferax sp. LjRoot39 TaxID=3342328 RepID=UPI003F4FBB43
MNALGSFAHHMMAIGQPGALPTLIRDQGLTMLQFTFMKELAAYACIEGARRRGELRPGQAVIETSSGNMAYGLARVCATLFHPLTIVSADLDPWLQSALIAHGVRLELVDAGGSLERVQQVRLERLHQLIQPLGAYWPCQYDNPDNANGYTAAAEMLVRQQGLPDILVCPVGSGGNSLGLITLLRGIQPETRLVGVDCFGSVTFGLPMAQRELGGIGNSVMPNCVVHENFDEVHFINGAVAIDGARRIQADGFGDFGLTSGAAYVVARWHQQRNSSARIAVVFPDRGFRYADTLATAPAFDTRGLAPSTVRTLDHVAPPWSRILWSRLPLTHWTGTR